MKSVAADLAVGTRFEEGDIMSKLLARYRDKRRRASVELDGESVIKVLLAFGTLVTIIWILR